MSNVNLCNMNKRTGWCDYCQTQVQTDFETGVKHCLALESDMKSCFKSFEDEEECCHEEACEGE